MPSDFSDSGDGSTFYRLSSSAATQPDAKANCGAEGARLAEYKTAEEYERLGAFLGGK